VADEAVSGEPVSGRNSLQIGKMQGDFENMQRGANCNRGQNRAFLNGLHGPLPTHGAGRQSLPSRDI
jgi:hypothetical protein